MFSNRRSIAPGVQRRCLAWAAIARFTCGITAVQATARTLPTAHTIWELVLHIDLWADIAFRATMGIPMPKLYGTGKDWTKPFTGSEDEWVAAQGHLFETGERLAGEIEAFDDARLSEIVPGVSTISTTSFMALCNTASTTPARSPY